MITKLRALELITNIVRDKKVHRDYPRVTRYAALLKKLVTGEGMDDLLKRFALREDEELFRQRVLLTEHITKPLARQAYKPLNKISGQTPIINEITYENGDNSDKAKQNEAILKKSLETIWGGESIDTYLEKRYGDLCAYDPNAFLLVTFPPFDYVKEKPQPYISEVTSSEMIFFEYFNNVLQYGVIKGDVEIPMLEGGQRVVKSGAQYQLYADNDTIDFRQLNEKDYASAAENILIDTLILNPTNESDDFYGKQGTIIKFKDNRVFLVRFYEQKSGVVPLVRIGSVPDPLTDGRTMLSILDNALPYFMKTIKTVSEMDLGMSLHAFLQKIVRTPRCMGAEGDKCTGGKNREGHKCTACNGTGIAKTHTSGQDIIQIALPQDESDMEKMFGLEKLVHYVELPIDILKFQKEFIDDLKADIVKAIYNSDVFTRSQIADTATAKNIEQDSVNDTLQPYAGQYSAIRCYVTKVNAHYLDIGAGLIVRHKFARDFKLRGLNLLLADLKSANDSNAPEFVKEEINRDIANNLFQDRPQELKRLHWKERFFPFSGKSESQIAMIISTGRCKRETEVLWSEFKNIFVAVEQAAEEKGIFFYDQPYIEMKKQIDAEVQNIILAIDEAKTVTIEFDAKGKPTDPAKGKGGGAPAPPKKEITDPKIEEVV